MRGVGHRAGLVEPGLASEGLTPKEASEAALSWWVRCPGATEVGGWSLSRGWHRFLRT